jgi:drug/metabolite transporter (DMT)-like permease
MKWRYGYAGPRRHAVLNWVMATDDGGRAAARRTVSLGHLLVGGVALVFAGAMVVAGSDPNAELGGVLLPLGLVLALAAAGFTYSAVMVLRRAPDERHDLSLVLSIVELLLGGALAAGLITAMRSYGEPWRSPLLLPSALLLALGLAGLRLELSRRAPTP